jgi:hypothetical protein
VIHIEGRRLWLALTVSMAGVLSAHGTSPSLQAVVDAVARGGIDIQLPAHLSVVLGVSSTEQPTAVKQAVVRDAQSVRTFNVCVANRENAVILTYDESSHTTKAYLVSPAGVLRKAVSYQAGGPANERSLTAARSDFAGEVKFWTHLQHVPGQVK